MSMTTQEIVNWVMHTPGNTNPRILGELIDNAVGPGPEPTETANCLYINNLDTITYHFFYASTWDECKEKLAEFTPALILRAAAKKIQKLNV